MWPSACMRARRSGERRALTPMTKNVARALSSASVSRMAAVESGVGPSSNVRAYRDVFVGPREWMGPQRALVGETDFQARAAKATPPADARPRAIEAAGGIAAPGRCVRVCA